MGQVVTLPTANRLANGRLAVRKRRKSGIVVQLPGHGLQGGRGAVLADWLKITVAGYVPTQQELTLLIAGTPAATLHGFTLAALMILSPELVKSTATARVLAAAKRATIRAL